MTDSRIQAAFTAYVDAATPGNLQALQSAITSDPSFERGTPWLDRARELVQQDRHDEVIRLVMERMPGLLMCPPAHALLGHAYSRIGNRQESQRETAYATIAVEAIRQSGSGSESDPWQVLHVADEYHFLAELGLDPVSQRMIDDGGIRDVITCSDGTERWFELV